MDTNESAYLLAYFTGDSDDGEQIRFALSHDGLHWKDTNGGRPVIITNIGTKGARDPFIMQSRIDGNYYLIATDLRIASGYGWSAAVNDGSTKMLLWTSSDLVHWSEPWTYDVPLPNIGCVWAPEAIYDEARGCYLVFWASHTRMADSTGKHIIYCSQTTDFHVFSEPQKYIERASHVIDTTIVQSGGVYYRFSKDESDSKNILLDCGTDLLGTFTKITTPTLDAITGVEGPTAYVLPDGKTWCLLVDRFATGKGYYPLFCDDLQNAVFREATAASYDLGASRKRHGSVLAITAADYERVATTFGL